ncbi:LSU ribosomal protein L30P [Fluviicoccus keumensis]|uniref:Large ribosomal subunit protein uL30 n=1 Tax=Fluviicoccus keumensis TaxID=1435465 RepID=A0A4Q7Z9T5_9GAMM|nr:50S ribosomal protein L30 [Fluviicoccus keumensis]RZU47322.1 LSU ribosomal protein L30P [Fluviicoccus keumensis]
MSQATIKVTQIKSSAHKLKNHKLCLKGLGLRRIGHTVEVLDTPDNRGMINKVYYLVKVEA